MPLYTAKILAETQIAPAEFNSRGVHGKPFPLSQLDVFAIPDFPQFAYNAYTTVLPHFIKAAATKKRIRATDIGCTFNMAAEHFLPIPLPPLVTSFIFDHDTDAEKALLEEFAHTEFTPEGEGNKDTIYTFKRPTVGLMMRLVALKAMPGLSTPVSAVNMGVMRQFLTALKIASAFLLAHNYSAFNGEADPQEKFPETWREFIGMKRTAGHLEKLIKKMAKIQTEEDTEEEDEMAEDEPEENLADAEIVVSITTSAGSSESIPWANPPSEFKPIFMKPADIPSGDGLVFPYFPGLLEDDHSFIPGLMREYFLQSLGETAKEMTEGYKAFKKAHSSWMRTASGHIMMHVFQGIKLAITGQCRMIPMFLNEGYQGFILLGGRFSVNIMQEIVRPLPEMKFRAEAMVMTLHDIAVKGIVERLNKMKIKKGHGRKAVVKVSEITGARDLYTRLAKMELDEDTSKTITQLANDLTFPEAYWRFNVENVVKLIDYIADTSQSLPDDAPMYLGGGVITSSDALSSVLAAFGPEAPSVLVEGGRKFVVPGKGIPDVASEMSQRTAKGKARRPLERMVITRKPIKLAHADWTRVLFERAIYQKEGRSAIYKSLVSAGEDRDRVWNALKALIQTLPDHIVPVAAERKNMGVEVPKNKKRKFDDDVSFAEFC